MVQGMLMAEEENFNFERNAHRRIDYHSFGKCLCILSSEKNEAAIKMQFAFS